MNTITTTAHMPESIPEGEVWIEVYDGRRDDFGRVRFFAYWHADIRWRGGGMVQAQVFHADEREFTRREQERGKTVRVMPAAAS